MNITINVEEMDQYTKVYIGGELDVYTAPKLQETIFPHVKANQTLIIDLTEVTYLDSTGLGIFVGLFKSLNAKNGTLQLVGLSGRLKRLFDITGLSGIMNIHSEVEGGV
ncbi:STAS domain-containing protein [Bacillus sp. FJAT-42315]|uniref:STAS domain-containing protein n=1 Tax=Bacillus sp. FJAT-42315 TaxID=2014077 RepID=UPI000C244509|nr:STAS domain-containing protein [Bacillus sp. FJAT-42315]